MKTFPFAARPRSRYINSLFSTRITIKPSIETIDPETRPTFACPSVRLLSSPYRRKMTPAIVTNAKYVQLGTSGLRISNPILGAMSFGEANWMAWCLDEAVALPILKSAYDQGINTWDTSNNYSNGLSEKIIAKAIKMYEIPRENLVIMTKCYFPVGGSCLYSGSLWSLC